jgi:hypothetical protein
MNKDEGKEAVDCRKGSLSRQSASQAALSVVVKKKDANKNQSRKINRLLLRFQDSLRLISRLRIEEQKTTIQSSVITWKMKSTFVH